MFPKTNLKLPLKLNLCANKYFVKNSRLFTNWLHTMLAWCIVCIVKFILLNDTKVARFYLIYVKIKNSKYILIFFFKHKVLSVDFEPLCTSVFSGWEWTDYFWIQPQKTFVLKILRISLSYPHTKNFTLKMISTVTWSTQEILYVDS